MRTHVKEEFVKAKDSCVLLCSCYAVSNSLRPHGLQHTSRDVIYSFNRYLSRAYYLPDTMLCDGYGPVTKANKCTPSEILHSGLVASHSIILSKPCFLFTPQFYHLLKGCAGYIQVQSISKWTILGTNEPYCTDTNSQTAGIIFRKKESGLFLDIQNSLRWSIQERCVD